MGTNTKKPKGCFSFRSFFIGLIIFSCFFYVFFLRGCIEQSKESDTLMQARDLGLSLFQYANDNNGKYPEGQSSTEIFQKLLDGGYLGTESGKDSAVLDLLYYPMPGKVKAAPGTKKLKPENICWDVTCCLNTRSPEALPTLFLTGYKVNYQGGGGAVPLPHPPCSWLDWWEGKDYPISFITVNYMSNNSVVLKASPDGTIHNLISPDFFDPSPHGKTYHQLTPDGELAP
jgi:hypothetical protein